MTRVVYYIDDSEFSIYAKGHAGFADIGNDIVCAGISTLLQTLVAYMDTDDYMIENGELWCYGNGSNVICADMVIKGLRLLEEQFPDHIRVIEGCTIHRDFTLI